MKYPITGKLAFYRVMRAVDDACRASYAVHSLYTNDENDPGTGWHMRAIAQMYRWADTHDLTTIARYEDREVAVACALQNAANGIRS